MKPPPSSTGSAPLKFMRRLHALIRPGSQRLSANVTSEDDWEVDEPQIRMSRAFAVMLVLHLVAVGGLFAFHMFGRDDRENEAASNSTTVAALPAAVVPDQPSPAAAAPVIPRAEVVQEETGPQKHTFRSGESKMVVAAKFGITVRELEEANPDSTFAVNDSLNIPHAPRIVGALAQTSPSPNPPLHVMDATPSVEIAQREFALKKDGEDPYAPVAPVPVLEDSHGHGIPQAKLVKAEPEPVEAAEESEAEAPAAAPKPRKPLPPAAAAKPRPVTGSRTHVIQKGDTVYNVAKRYGLPPGEIMRANNITDPARVQMGQVLKITVKR